MRGIGRRANRASDPRNQCKDRLYAGFCPSATLARRAVAIIPLGRRSRAGSSHLPAASPSQVNGCLFGVAPRRDCPFHPAECLLTARLRAPPSRRLVSVALILASRRAGVTCYGALGSPDVPRHVAVTRSPGGLCGGECKRAAARRDERGRPSSSPAAPRAPRPR